MIKIIKAFTAPSERPASRDQDLGFVDLSHDIDIRIERAHREAAAIVAQAQEQADQIRSQAAAQGEQAALQAARTDLQQQLEAKLATAVPALDNAIRSIQQERTIHLRECEAHVVRLALAIAEKLVRAELSHQPEIPLRLIREALELASGSQQIRLHLNPEDFQTLQSSLDGLTAGQHDSVRVDVVADVQVTRGGCLVRSEFGCIDQQFETQLARIQEELA